MPDYSLTKNRTFQWMIIILILVALAGAYRYFSVRASTKMNAPQNSLNTSGLVGQWSFDGADISGTTAYDRSGSGNNGTLTNGPVPILGKVGQALNFDGTNDYVDVGTPASLALTTSVTLSAWVYLNSSFSSGYQNIVGKWNDAGGTGNRRYSLALSGTGTLNGAVIFASDSSGVTTYTISTSPLSIFPGTWVHVVGVINISDATQQIYINGNLDANGTSKAASLDNTETRAVEIGNHTSNTAYFNGKIDDVRIYNRALSTTEIQSLYDLGQGDKINSSVSQPQGTGRLDSGLAGYWALDDNTGTSATDSSTNGNTGTLTNGPAWTTGKLGQAITLNGTTQYADMGTSFNFTSQPFTLSGWFNVSSFTTVPATGPIIFFQGAWQYKGYYAAIGTDGSVSFNTNQANANQASNTAAGVISLNQWYLISITRSGSSVRIYVNGIDRTSTAGTHIDPASSPRSFSIGRYFLGNGTTYIPSMYASVDEVRIYNRALSDDEVSQLYRLTSPTGVDTSLKGYWSFNGQDMNGTVAYDSSGVGNNGTLVSGPAKVPGKLGQALDFDGTIVQSVDSLANSTTIANLTQSSVAFWIYPQRSGSQGSIFNIIGTDGGGNGPYTGGGFMVSGDTYFNTQKIRFIVDGSTTDMITYSSTLLTLNAWTHVVVVWDGSLTAANVKFYFNGILSGTTGSNGAGSYVAGSGKFRIGAYVSGTIKFNGRLDEVRVYNRALSAGEVTSLYNMGAGVKVIAP